MRKLLIWGTGNIASELCENGLNGSIEGFIETKKKKNVFQGKPVYGMDERWPDYDYLIIANSFSNEVYETCNEKNIDMRKAIFLKPIKMAVGEHTPKILAELLGEKNYTEYCIEYRIFSESFFEADYKTYEQCNRRKQFAIDDNNLWPILADKYKKAGIINNYFWQDLWAARLINKTGMKTHFDIGSKINGFIGHLLAMGIDVTMIDIREFPWKVEGLHTIIDDATTLRQIPENSIESMSALCSLEHFGLGRYGDAVEPEACFICFEEIQKRMRQGGHLYISLPVGRERVEFNAHRVFYPSTVINCFLQMDLLEFSCTAEGEIEYHVDIHKYDEDEHNGDYRYGLFHFMKK